MAPDLDFVPARAQHQMQLAAEMLNQFAGLSITTVRYAGSAAAVNALR